MGRRDGLGEWLDGFTIFFWDHILVIAGCN
jgi:hypothetical protein